MKYEFIQDLEGDTYLIPESKKYEFQYYLDRGLTRMMLKEFGKYRVSNEMHTIFSLPEEM